MKYIKNVIFLFLFLSSIQAYGNPITVGITKFAGPFVRSDVDNHYFGFSIDIINEICKRIQEQCEFKSVTTELLLDQLIKGDVDITITSTPIPQESSSQYIFSLPYMPSIGQFVTINPNIKSFEDLQNKKIGVLSESNLKNVLVLYTSEDNIKEYSEVDTLINALVNNDIDAILLNVNILKYFTNNKIIIGVRPIGKPISLGNGYGLLALRKNAALIDKINKALLQMENDGTYEAIYNKYFEK